MVGPDRGQSVAMPFQPFPHPVDIIDTEITGKNE
jgi:hypothetical protein